MNSIKHYTLYLLTLLLTAFIFQGCLNAQGPSYNLYSSCNEYYDSRGFYHKECDKNKLDRRKLRKSLKIIKAEIDPGDGIENNNSKLGKLASTIDDIIDDTTPEDPTLKGENGNSESSTPAIKERPKLEFGREGQ